MTDIDIILAMMREALTQPALYSADRLDTPSNMRALIAHIDAQAARIDELERVVIRVDARNASLEGKVALAEIRQRTGVGGTPMLSELPDAVTAAIEAARRETAQRCAKIARENAGAKGMAPQVIAAFIEKEFGL